jgi:arylsulfatase
MITRLLPRLLALGGLYLLGSTCMVQADSPPNVLVILADDLGYSDLSCYGGEIQTPNIDRLASGGLRFSQFYNSARCCPSRASLMTGLYPTQTGIGDFTLHVPDEKRGPGYLGRLNGRCATIAEVLEPRGYGCYYVGKWHIHPQTGPIDRGFHEFYGYTRDHSHDQYDRDFYVRLPQGRAKEIEPPKDQFYATDAFNEYAIEFIKQGQSKEKPWLLFLAHSSPHFPIQAPVERVERYVDLYRLGWDRLRAERFERMKTIGLIDSQAWTLSPLSNVPVDSEPIANGFSGKPNPAWDSLPVDRQNDLAQRMAVYAAMVESIDMGVGKILNHLEKTNELDRTLILFLSDNGACYEWGPFGFDGDSRKGITKLHTQEELRQIGRPGTHQAYGSAWANLSNTPLRSYKHFTYEGGIINPCILLYPPMTQQASAQQAWVHHPSHMIDVMPTILEATGAKYPTQDEIPDLHRLEGHSLFDIARGEQRDRTLGFDHQAAHGLRQGDWKVVWTKRSADPIRWELFHLSQDRCETQDVSNQHPERLKQMVTEWERWASRVLVDYKKLW